VVGALSMGVDPFFRRPPEQIVTLAVRYAVPAIYDRRAFAAAGGLMTYDWTARYPLICEAVAAILARSVIIDGEAVDCDAAGVSIFHKLRSRGYDDHVIVYAFDLIELDGVDQRPNPRVARKRLLEKVLAKPNVCDVASGRGG
jgi:hypothetical protein